MGHFLANSDCQSNFLRVLIFGKTDLDKVPSFDVSKSKFRAKIFFIFVFVRSVYMLLISYFTFVSGNLRNIQEST